MTNTDFMTHMSVAKEFAVVSVVAGKKMEWFMKIAKENADLLLDNFLYLTVYCVKMMMIC